MSLLEFWRVIHYRSNRRPLPNHLWHLMSNNVSSWYFAMKPWHSYKKSYSKRKTRVFEYEMYAPHVFNKPVWNDRALCIVPLSTARAIFFSRVLLITWYFMLTWNDVHNGYAHLQNIDQPMPKWPQTISNSWLSCNRIRSNEPYNSTHIICYSRY